MEEIVARLGKNLAELRQNFRSGRTRGLVWRKTQLRAILKLVAENEDEIFEALNRDLGKHPAEAYRDEIGVVKKSAEYSLHHIEKWMAPKKGQLPLLLFPAKAEVLPEPLGVVLVFASWNFPISLALDPLIGAISAGNTVVVKPSELAPACSSFLARIVPLYLDNKAIKVVEGGSDVAEKLLEQKWEKIFFTGSPRVGRIIMSAAAKHLTPVTLELGGKCPIILDSLSGSDLKVTVKRISGGKWGACAGQACIGIDYVLVQRKLAPVLVELLQKCIKTFYGENIKNLNSICKIVNKNHFERVCNLLEDPGVAASIVYATVLHWLGCLILFKHLRLIEPTILLDPPLDAAIMTEEIFGPLLPIITLNDVEESIEFINARPNPLAIYVFTKNKTFKEKLLQETSSGSVIFNDTMIQFICDGLPFGGVGQSGFGRYHGKYSFDTFSHEKAILQRSFFLELEPRYPPWNGFKLEFIRLAYNFDYIGLLLLLFGLRRRYTSRTVI
ncbi:aldehyde dehydrogenase family 3 member F1 [Olea europaea subsp. europaea]|uniref:Aldehyde dehydrogenase n=1 Tax=Olea europaea subsp. europaea TaxID=158383 RepID=A0A8S0RVC3_OLEEU|nr:aldehyde dehydrogenase family 3 member F1 [Olea europaea subsp. europaea]